MREETAKSFQNILDTITCSDGGSNFLSFRFFIEEIDRQAEAGDIDSSELLLVMTRFSALLDIAKD